MHKHLRSTDPFHVGSRVHCHFIQQHARKDTNIDQAFLPLELVMQLSNKYHACIIVATRAWWKPYNVHMVDDLYNNTNY